MSPPTDAERVVERRAGGGWPWPRHDNNPCHQRHRSSRHHRGKHHNQSHPVHEFPQQQHATITRDVAAQQTDEPPTRTEHFMVLFFFFLGPLRRCRCKEFPADHETWAESTPETHTNTFTCGCCGYFGDSSHISFPVCSFELDDPPRVAPNAGEGGEHCVPGSVLPRSTYAR